MMESIPLHNLGTTKNDNKNWRNFTETDLSVDFVLVYRDSHYNNTSSPDGNKHQTTSPNSNNSSANKHTEKRANFEKNLEKVGLKLEYEQLQKLHFVKIHVPFDVLCQYAEFLKIRVPIKNEFQDEINDARYNSSIVLNSACGEFIRNFYRRWLHPRGYIPQKHKLQAVFSRDKRYLFNMDDLNLFSNNVRITVISYILERERFGENDQDKGLKRLISEGVYKAAYPLHDFDLHSINSKRRQLLTDWAMVSKCIKFQPLDDIKEYFGVKIALYFTWLGFYTHMLIPITLIGILCLVFGATTLNDNNVVRDFCHLNITMCPRCSRYCDYWQLSEGCTYAKIQHFIDNPATVVFAILMSFWSALYLETWKRYSAGIAHNWGISAFDMQAEPPRPEYLTRLASAKRQTLNTVTQLHEPKVPYWRVKVPSLVLSFSIVLVWTVVTLAIVFGITIYRMSMVTSEMVFADRTAVYTIYVVPVTSAIINLICIVILNWLYDRLAYWLTELELQRTQTEFDDSLALKMYIFQFINYYSSIFYVAFFKGKFVGYPAKYNHILGYRQEECIPGGCLMELSIQLAIIMIGNQTLNAIVEMLTPLLQKMYTTLKVSSGIQKAAPQEDAIVVCNQWTEDYKLAEFNSANLFTEYLEMVLQYGFVTIFVTAFPLAPLFALLNNILEMRLDAKKLVKYYRRPIPQRVRDIGVWLPIMEIIGRISVVSNAFIVAFSSNFIVRLVYAFNEHQGDNGLLEFMLAYFDTNDFQTGTAPEMPSAFGNVTTCRYMEFRNPPDHKMKYKRPLIYWQVLAARLAFVVVYQNVVNFVITAVDALIPDVPKKLNAQIQRETYKTNELIIKYETEMAHEYQHTI